MMEPLSMAVITRMISEYGEEAVARVWCRRAVRSPVADWALGVVYDDHPLLSVRILVRAITTGFEQALRFGGEILADLGRGCVHSPLPPMPALSHQFLTITKQ